MTIAIQSCNSTIVNELSEMGYTIINFDETPAFADAILYQGHISNTFESGIYGNDNGIFIINTEGKSAREIDEILQKRLYSPFFSM